MSRPPILDPKIMSKIANKIGKTNITAINVMVSKKASKLGISSEAALIVLAKQFGIGTATFQRKLEQSKQAEVRDSLPTIFAPDIRTVKNTKNITKKLTPISSRRTLLKS